VPNPAVGVASCTLVVGTPAVPASPDPAAAAGAGNSVLPVLLPLMPEVGTADAVPGEPGSKTGMAVVTVVVGVGRVLLASGVVEPRVLGGVSTNSAGRLWSPCRGGRVKRSKEHKASAEQTAGRL
jgi:hypothetical protein